MTSTASFYDVLCLINEEYPDGLSTHSGYNANE